MTALLKGKFRRFFRRHGGPLFFVMLLALYAAIPLVYHRMLLTHEGDDLYDRVDEIQREVRRGFLQPMLFPSGMHGMGYAFPIFYPPLPYYMAAIVSAMCGHLFLGVNITLALSLVVSASGAYVCAFSLGRRRWIAAAIAIAYIATPYRFGLTAVRGAMGEAWAMAFAPYFFYAGQRVLTIGKAQILLAVTTAGMLLSHAVLSQWIVAALFPMFLTRWALYRKTPGHYKRFATFAAAGVLGFGLTAWFTIPQMTYLPSVWVSDLSFMWSSTHFVETHRVAFPQFFTTVPEQWRGGSEGWGLEDTMSFSLGMMPWLAAAALGFTVLSKNTEAWNNCMNRHAIITGTVLFVTAAVCCAFMLYPAPFLAILPGTFTYIQFPWRMLGPTALFFTMSIACFSVPWGKRIGIAAPLLLGAGFVLVIPDFQRQALFNETIRPADFTSLQSTTKDRLSGFDIKGEYLPRSYPVDDITTASLLSVPPGASNVRLSSIKSDGSYELRASLQSPGTFVLPLVYYPFYVAQDSAGRPITLKDSHGLISLEAAQGNLEVIINRRYTAPYYAGWIVTLGVLSALILLRFWPLKRKSRTS